MNKTIAVSNQKGGVGKTTTAINLGACLAMAGKKILLVDIDPQANTTSGLGHQPDADTSIYNALINQNIDNGLVCKTPVDSLFLIPADINLIGAELELIAGEGRELRLKRIIKHLSDGFDFIIIDCPPSLGLLTLNGLVAADSVIIPLQTEYYALEGLKLLMNTIERVRDSANPSLEIEGILFTMYDSRTTLANQVVYEVRKHFKDDVFKTVIPRNVRLAESPSHGLPIQMYDPKSKGSEAYIELARELIRRQGGNTVDQNIRGENEIETSAR